MSTMTKVFKRYKLFIILGIINIFLLILKPQIGILLSFFLGSAAAGPLYAAFPVAGVLLKKGTNLPSA